MAKGFNPEKAAKMADAITARLNGQELTRIQTDRLRSAIDSPAVQSVISDMQKTLISRGDKVSQKPTARNVGQSNTTVQAAINRANTVVNQADVAKSLRSKGVYSKEVEGIAEAITARLNGQELTRTQTSILRSAIDSPTVQSVISDIQKSKANRSDNVSPDFTARNVGQSDATAQAVSSQANASENRASVVANQANTVVTQEEVAKSLRSKGVYSKEVVGIAEAIVARLNGQALTRRQRSTLSLALNTSAVRDTITEFINRRKTYTEQPSQNIPENMLPDQTSGDSEKLQQYQIPKRRSNEFSEATNLPEQYEGLEKTGAMQKDGKVAGKTVQDVFKNPPTDLLELSAKIDGVTWFRELFQIITPLVWSTISMTLIVAMTGLFTTGGPIMLFGTTEESWTISYYIFSQVHDSGIFYYPASMGIFFTLISMPIVLGFRYIMNKLDPKIEY